MFSFSSTCKQQRDVCVCMYACMRVCVSVYMRVCVSVCMCVCVTNTEASLNDRFEIALLKVLAREFRVKRCEFAWVKVGRGV